MGAVTRDSVNGALEAFALHLRESPSVSAVTIDNGRRRSTFGVPIGEPTSECEVAPGVRVSIWGPCSPLLDAMFDVVRSVDHREHEIDDLVEALSQAHDRQLRLFELSRLSVDTLDRQAILERTLRYGVELTESTDAVLLEGSTVLTWFGEGYRPRPEWMVDVAAGVAEATGQGAVSTADGLRVLFNRVTVDGRQLTLAFGRSGDLRYGTPERKVASSLAASMASALQLVELHESAMQRAIVANEHDTAARLAAAALPESLPVLDGLDVVARTVPARAVGGDFYTAVRRGPTLRFAVGDVSGKGLPAAVVMTNAITATHGVFERATSDDPMDLLGEVHMSLDRLLVGTSRFVTMCVGVARPIGTGRVEVSLANAGHSPVIVVLGTEVVEVPPHAPPVGVGSTPAGVAFRCVLQRGDALFVGSDGLLEQDGVDGEMFGSDRLASLIAASTQRSAAEVLDAVFDAVGAHAGSYDQSDDETLLVLRPAPIDSVPLDPGPLDRVGHGPTTAVTPCPAVAPAAVLRRSDLLVMDADLLAVRALGPWLEAALQELLGAGVAGELSSTAELALHELCINIVEHAHRGCAGSIEMQLEVVDSSVSTTEAGRGLRCTVTDRGLAFEPASVREPDPDVPTVRGYGLSLIRQLTSEVRYERIGVTNRWTVGFDLPTASPVMADAASDVESDTTAPRTTSPCPTEGVPS